VPLPAAIAEMKALIDQVPQLEPDPSQWQARRAEILDMFDATFGPGAAYHALSQ
jgi:hypothetical protein